MFVLLVLVELLTITV